MRWVVAIVMLGACTLGADRAPVLRAPVPDPDRMPTEVLDKQDPAADTSSHPVTYVRGGGGEGKMFPNYGCAWVACSSSGGDAGGLLVIGALALAVRRRRRA